MNLIQTVLAFLFALGPLIIFHELGHYTVARLCGVKVLRFSVGMGKVVWSRRIGVDQTEWAISVLPLGGYVKMLDSRDQDAPAMTQADLAREFTRQSVWRRIAIVIAGPLANFLLAIVVYAGLFMHGVMESPARIGFMAENSAAFRAGLRGGDEIVTVNGKAVGDWSDLRREMMSAALDKNGARLDVASAAVNGAIVQRTLPASAFAGAELDGDIMGKLGLAENWPPAAISQVIAGGPAARAGLQAGDKIVAIDGAPVADGRAFIEAIRASKGRTLAILVRRDGVELTCTVTPDIDAKTHVPRIMAAPVPPETRLVARAPLAALAKAGATTWDSSVMIVRMIGKMITGEVSLRNVTGPITIADFAGQTARMGPSVYLGFIAFISISLGVMNLLPIPVLDGGLLLYYSLEVLTGRPLPERIGDIAQRIGIGLLVMLMALAVFNDVVRLL
jgi:regulator of sigma E protease